MKLFLVKNRSSVLNFPYVRNSLYLFPLQAAGIESVPVFTSGCLLRRSYFFDAKEIWERKRASRLWARPAFGRKNTTPHFAAASVPAKSDGAG